MKKVLKEKISIFGLGYVGCISLGCLARYGHEVTGIDISKNKVELINRGKPTIIEKDIDLIIKKQYERGNISATQDYINAVKKTDISIICVGTPSTSEGHLDMQYIYKTSEEIGEALIDKSTFHIVVIRSTVFPGTNVKVGEIIEKISGKKRNVDFSVVSNPEFLREGTAVYDYINPPLTVLGGDNEKSLSVMSEVYSELNGEIQIVDINVAEIIKYVNNSFHALKIVFGNEIGNICKKLGIDSHKVMELFCMDKQLNISPYYFRPGFAYGGSCLPKDLKGLRTIAHDNYLLSPVLNSIEDSNNYQKRILFEMIINSKSLKIAVLGLSFKSGTDDLRYSPMVQVTEMLLGKGRDIKIYDRNVSLSKLTGTNRDYIDRHLHHLSKLISEDLNEVIDFADLIIITQNSIEFSDLISNYPDKKFIDVVRVTEDIKRENYTGICW